MCLVCFTDDAIQVFSAFGFVHKIATFEKAAGFQVRLSEEKTLFCLNHLVTFFVSFDGLKGCCRRHLFNLAMLRLHLQQGLN